MKGSEEKDVIKPTQLKSQTVKLCVIPYERLVLCQNLQFKSKSLNSNIIVDTLFLPRNVRVRTSISQDVCLLSDFVIHFSNEDHSYIIRMFLLLLMEHRELCKSPFQFSLLHIGSE